MGRRSTLHVCVDMQRLFAEETDWKTPWMDRVLPNVVRLVEAYPDKTLFTRFIPAARPGDGVGVWRRHWRRWENMTLEKLGREMIELLPELARYASSANVFDKCVYPARAAPASISVASTFKTRSGAIGF